MSLVKIPISERLAMALHPFLATGGCVAHGTWVAKRTRKGHATNARARNRERFPLLVGAASDPAPRALRLCTLFSRNVHNLGRDRWNLAVDPANSRYDIARRLMRAVSG